MTLQDQYDDAMFDFSQGEFDAAIAKLKAILGEDPGNFDAQLSLGMAYYRKGEYDAAIAEGHKAEKLRPNEQLVHTNLSLFYMRRGDKQTAEHHGLQARIASWKSEGTAPPAPTESPELAIAKAKPPVLPEMPWKKKKTEGTPAGSDAPRSPSPDESTSERNPNGARGATRPTKQ